MNLKFLFSLMFFITDCDKTLVHYENNNDITNLLSLPSSSGSNKIGYVHLETINLLNDISKNDKVDAIICCSGMRISTMLQRYSYFPSISYWITENGGRIFEVNNNNDGDNIKIPVEIIEWKELLLSDVDNFQKLILFQNYLKDNNWDVDGITENNNNDIKNTNYSTMIRIKKNMNDIDYKTIIPLIPPSLKYSLNLGYLDIYLPNSGKLSSSKWLMNYIRNKNKNNNNNNNNKDNINYFFMGDDDNDIECANDSDNAFIVNPCSESMKSFFINSNKKDKLIISNELYHKSSIHLLQTIKYMIN